MSPALPTLAVYSGTAYLPPATRRYRHLWAMGLCLLGITLLWDIISLDMALMGWFGDANGFSLRHNWWLETLLHDRAKHLCTLALAISVWAVWRPFPALAPWSRSQRMALLGGVIISLCVISSLKKISLTSCPWELVDFGGTAQYVSHWAWGQSDGGGGRCFPGGHVSSAFAFLAMAVPLIGASSRPLRQLGWLIAGASLGVGLLFGVVQTLRGAHFPSHTLWTMCICWGVGCVTDLVCRTLTRGQSSPRNPPL